jgi:hypothetical protein
MATTDGGKTVYRVAPAGDAWVIELAGDSVREFAPIKGAAIARARELARRAPRGGVVVVGADGRVEEEFDVERLPAG